MRSQILTIPFVSMVAIAAGIASPAVAAQSTVRNFDVPRQPATTGLVRFAQQAGIQILAPSDVTRGQIVSAVRGQLSIEEGLKRLIAPSRLRLVSFDGRTAVIGAAAPAKPRTVDYVAPQDGGMTPGGAQAGAAGATSPDETAQADAGAQSEIIVTGNTSDRRTLFNSSSNVTLASAADLLRKAPRSTAETLELVPGVFVEGTAGPISNNYSVRGLRGGAQTFITLEEDGMPILYGGGGADFYFQNDITINRLEAVEGGTSGVLAPNGAGATINFISLKPDHDKATAMVRYTGTTYGDLRADGYFSAPIADGWAFNVGGYVTSQKGVRRTPFTFNAYDVKAMLEKKFSGGGLVRFTVKHGDKHFPYYADMPFRVSANGDISSVPGLDLKRDDAGGRGFTQFLVPNAPATGESLRRFSSAEGVHVKANTYRIDVEVPVSPSLRLFGRARYLDGSYDFNGIFPGSGSGTAGLTSALNYLTPASSPLAGLTPLQGSPLTYFQVAALRFPGVAQYGLRNIRTGQVIAASNTAALNGLNGNGLLQQTVLNHQTLTTKDFGSDFGAKWDFGGGNIDNSLTVGGMVYNVRRSNNQSAVATVLNDVRNDSNVYDMVALNAAGGVLGSLTNNGMVNYGNWGQGLFNDEVTSLSAYFNDELTIGDRLHIDFGARYEHQHVRVDIGNSAAVNAAVPAGTPGLYDNVGSTFRGTYTRQTANYSDWAYTAGINYELTDHVALYVRGAHGFQTNGGDTGGTHAPSGLTLYEGGVRFKANGFNASVIGFRTEFRDQSYQFINPANPAQASNALADNFTNGVQLDATLRPVEFFSLNVQGVYQDPKLSNLRFNGVAQPQYDGNTPERTPKKLLTVTPSFVLPGGLGEIYGRYKYVGKIFADSGNGIALPEYGVFSIGASIDATPRLNLSVSVDNLTDVKGFTEGNPRQGQTQTIVDGYFYGRAIIGRNALFSATLKL
ncbi:TonB-dependent receptor domain-containing protein [Sphingomonas sanguinis]|jgi:iron complex outermembrane receptor protein|uniref:TonB-dependent receptor n=1 Tax=Sphingomonas sanguinis TaxID=33051 RepID=A0A7Y7UQM8_9SPHN|nr:TonB-dependent receptor [Sphingomonas sanguinis]MBZ6381133.1 TonB-dependent receptor [Sphingomonas sanguinis]NNG51263.1 TonB-dependent receptor [Sphingomonas sanguinis]NNG55213.1 TonB-dependent receptor [Sphingomonas sanguinis]NVP30435.1 TonB-dependent receptor [Sphingomonas sanguinis]